ncbi:DDE-type integrase/transposase/recombinase [Leptolyngbya sp. FACHB-541]|uniref:DDE-type integrase/transposase/recombinase n=1 Tax=Leptolyngbya sp. FACHB-541 TaxID=2692810 RepID=UPI001682CF75|nr:DDE-type integrase/transposase/recombinase [Leptolyngbya sp. FACHB-541]MBD1997241.1 DDE-type integrase/transposase/recombinase [Leptolyngbya sp. FACHB-541]
MLSAKRDGKAAARFFRKTLKAQHVKEPRVLNVDRNVAYPITTERLMNMLRKEQVQGVESGDVRSQVEFVSQIFGLVA